MIPEMFCFLNNLLIGKSLTIFDGATSWWKIIIQFIIGKILVGTTNGFRDSKQFFSDNTVKNLFSRNAAF